MRIRAKPRSGDDLSGLVWARECYYEVLGTPFFIRTEQSDVAEALDHLLAPFRRPRCGVPGSRRYSLVESKGGERPYHCLYRDRSLVLRSESWTRLAAGLLGEINLHALDGIRAFAVHAGVVAAGERALAFPGASGDGKSTLTAACLAAGFSYVSDEALCVEFSGGRVVPYPKPIMLSEHSRMLLGVPTPSVHFDGAGEEWAIPPEALGSAPATGELRLTDVVQLVRTPGSRRLCPLPAAEGMAMLLRMSFNHYKRPPESFELAARLARSSQSWALEYDDPRAAAELLHERLAVGVSP